MKLNSIACILLLLMMATTLVSCSSPNSNQAIAAQFQDFRVETEYFVDNPKEMSEEQIKAREEELLEPVKFCEQEYVLKFNEAVNQLSLIPGDKRPAAIKLPSEAMGWEKHFNQCLKIYGAKGNLSIVDGDDKKWSLPMYLNKYVTALANANPEPQPIIINSQPTCVMDPAAGILTGAIRDAAPASAVPTPNNDWLKGIICSQQAHPDPHCYMQ